MSFLGDLVDSIGNDRSPAPPTSLRRVENVKTQLGAASAAPPAARPGQGPGPSVTSQNGIKRKAEDNPAPSALQRRVRPNPTPGLTSSVSKRAAGPAHHARSPSREKVSLPATGKAKGPAAVTNSSTPASSLATSLAAATAKVPAKGSYADIMARAKQAQASRAHSQVGMIKHRPTNREKVSKVAERRRQEEEQAKTAKDKSQLLGRDALTRPVKSRSASPAKSAAPSRVTKDRRPANQAPVSTYKGTMGAASNRAQQQQRRQRRRYDEYLGTDEEDLSDDEGLDDGAVDHDASDVSSDMEVGAFDLDEEERRADRAAKDEDARELAIEKRLKQEKEDRRARLAAMAKRQR